MFISNVKHYMAIKTLVSLATGIFISIWLTIIGVDYPLLWGLLAFALNYVPNIGSIIAAIPAVLLAIIQLGFISLLFWGWVLGPVGMLLSVPLTITAKIALERREETRWIAVLLGPEIVSPPPKMKTAKKTTSESQ
ncbi:MAG: AI-2E family transporter [Thermodesulfobacteriota bacterium]